MPDDGRFRHGSAGFATDNHIKGPGLLRGEGLYLGDWGRQSISLPGDGPLITFAGARAGKMRDLLALNLCLYPGSMVVNDPKGEGAAISYANQVRWRKWFYAINPLRLHGLPAHGTNPLDILTPGSLTLHSYCMLFAEAIITLSGGSNAQYFELKAREWLAALLKWLVISCGSVNLPMLMRLINLIIAAQDAWFEVAAEMQLSGIEDVARIAKEMTDKQARGPKGSNEFGGIMGEITKSLAWVEDPVLKDCLGGEPDFSLQVICNRERAVNIHLMVPANFLGIWGPFLRIIILSAMLRKSRDPGSPSVVFVVDEAGQLKRFEALQRAFTFGAGEGARTWAIFQDIGQVSTHFGREGVQTFMASAQVRQFFGIRDLETAQLAAAMLGSQTFAYDEGIEQHAAKIARQQAIRDWMTGVDPFEAAARARFYGRKARHQTRIHRDLRTPDELLRLPEDEQLLFISGLNIPPILAQRHPYFSRPEMAGHYLPNPYHPPLDRVQIATRCGPSWRRVIREPVPTHLVDWPQHQDGTWSYIDGYRPT